MKSRIKLLSELVDCFLEERGDPGAVTNLESMTIDFLKNQGTGCVSLAGDSRYIHVPENEDPDEFDEKCQEHYDRLQQFMERALIEAAQAYLKELEKIANEIE